MSGALDPVGDAARTELTRLAHRWHSLPVGQARSAAERARVLAGDWLGADLPDLGPAAALDQLRVAVYERSRDRADDVEIGARLAEVRRAITDDIG